MAITWKNMGQSTNSGNSLISGASDTITSGLNSIQSAAQSVTDEQIRQHQQQVSDDTAKAINTLNSYRADDAEGRGQFIESLSDSNVNQSALANINRQQTTAQNIRSLMDADAIKKNNDINSKVDNTGSAFDPSIDYSTNKAFAKGTNLTNQQKIDNFKKFAGNYIPTEEDSGTVEARAIDAYINRLAKENALKETGSKNSSSRWSKLNDETLFNQSSGDIRSVESTTGSDTKKPIKLATKNDEDAYDDTVTSLQGAKGRVNQAQRLLNRVNETKLPAGVAGWTKDTVANIFGTQDEISAIRTEWNQITKGLALDNLPTGPASDKDVAFAMKGVPTEFTNREQMQKYLRGITQIQTIAAIRDQARLDFINRTGSRRGFEQEWAKNKDALTEKPLAIIRESFTNNDDSADYSNLWK